MSEAWNCTYREFCLLVDVKTEQRRPSSEKPAKFDRERMSEFERHLQDIGVTL